ncbi:exostosin-like 3 [Elysia marginata]|uniref:Exostosin-like 3 n=1 Tax=Elysia marginata TaxID=1093978 RepID=A0AAV4GBU1_9GAST|nr:exostosin-like 3 [Elysia marginata]
MQHSTLTREIGQVKLTLDQLRFQRDESQSYIPNIRAPVQIIKDTGSVWNDGDADNIQLQQAREKFSPYTCSMETCFDFSRCSLVSGFPVYFYDPIVHMLTPAGADSIATVNETILATVRQFFDQSVYRTTDPKNACVFIVLLAGGVSQPPGSVFPQPPSPYKMEKFLYDLPYWGGDGRNHVLLHLTQTESFDPLIGVNTGRALLAKTTFTDSAFREGFDVVIPPNTGPELGDNLWKNLPPLSPIRRKMLLSFWGQFVSPSLIPSHNQRSRTKHKIVSDDDAYISRKRRRRRKPLAILHDPHIPPSLRSEDVANRQKNSPYYNLERAIVLSVEAFSNSPQGDVLVDTSCAGEKILAASLTNSSLAAQHEQLEKSTPSDWALCGTEQSRRDILLRSTFSLVLAPLNTTVDSTLAFQKRVLEALQHGSIPLLVGSTYRSKKLLPFSESLRWESAAVTLPVPRITEVPFYLQSYPDEDIAALRLQGREFYQKFLGSTFSILETLLAVLRQRLDIPAHPIPEEPSPSAFSANFTPLAYDGPDIEPDTDEVLGPIEAPFASETFRRNFSAGLLSDMFNKFGDPFHLYPHTPFQPVLPSEAKFLGSNYGFRPVNQGAGGDGISFSQALGGNYQREQFTSEQSNNSDTTFLC